MSAHAPPVRGVSFLREVTPGVFVAKLYAPWQCAALCDLIAEQGADKGGPNTMNKYGARIRSRTLRRIVAGLVHGIVEPIARKQFGYAGLFRHPYAFSVEYTSKTQRNLKPHYDASDVTLNVCLSTKFKGGDLVLLNPVARTNGYTKFALKQQLGQAIIHRGSHIHMAKPITSGRRVNLVLWCRAKKGKAKS